MLAVNCSPNVALPLMITEPLSVAISVVNDAGELAGEAKCVAVSALRATKL